MSSTPGTKCIDDYFTDAILGKVFRHCQPDSFKTLRQVSKRWDRVADRFVGRVCVIKTGSTFRIDYESELDGATLKTNFLEAMSTRTEETEDTEEPGKIVELPEISNANQVRKIGFVGMFGEEFSLKILEHFLRPCENITGLYLHFSIFATPKKTTDDAHATQWNIALSHIAPNIRELVIDCSGMNCDDDDMMSIFNYAEMFKSLHAFLQWQAFPRLEKFICRLPYMESTEGILVRGMAALLGNHHKTIRSFSFHQKFEIDDEVEDDEESEDSDDEEHDEDSKKKEPEVGSGDCPEKQSDQKIKYLSLDQLALTASLMKKVSLEVFHVILLKARQESGPIWKNMLIQQNSLIKCIFAGDKMPAPIKTMEANASTLEILRLDICDIIDLKCLKKCSNLKHLSLCGKLEPDFEFDTLSEDDFNMSGEITRCPYAQLKNSAQLPKSLQSIEIINLRTHKDDARLISQKLPNLLELTFKNLGWESDLGLHLMDLVEIWYSRKLNHFCIKASMNMISFSELERATVVPPEINLLACVFQSNSFSAASRFSLEVWKTNKGIYTTIGPNTTLMEDYHGEDEFSADEFLIPNYALFKEDETLDDEESSSEEEESSRSESSGDEEEDEEGSESASDKISEAGDSWQECESSSESDEDKKKKRTANKNKESGKEEESDREDKNVKEEY